VTTFKHHYRECRAQFSMELLCGTINMADVVRMALALSYDDLMHRLGGE